MSPSPTRIAGSKTKTRLRRGLGLKSKHAMLAATWTAFRDASASASASENSSPLKPMTPCKSPVAPISSESAYRTKSSLASSCVKAPTAKIIF